MRLGWQKGNVFGNVEGAYQSLSISLGGGFYERHQSSMKRLTGNKRSFTFPPLSHQNRIYHTPSDISKLLADTYANISDNSNCEPHFISHKIETENIPINFALNEPHPSSLSYNHPITVSEVLSTITLCPKKSAPGID